MITETSSKRPGQKYLKSKGVCVFFNSVFDQIIPRSIPQTLKDQKDARSREGLDFNYLSNVEVLKLISSDLLFIIL